MLTYSLLWTAFFLLIALFVAALVMKVVKRVSNGPADYERDRAAMLNSASVQTETTANPNRQSEPVR